MNLLSIWSGYHKGMWLDLVFYHKEMYTYTAGSHSSSKDERKNISVFSLLIPYADNYQIQRYFIKNVPVNTWHVLTVSEHHNKSDRPANVAPMPMQGPFTKDTMIFGHSM